MHRKAEGILDWAVAGVYSSGDPGLAQGRWCQALYIGPGSPWENGYMESFNGKLRDELLNREMFETLREVQALIERWRRKCITNGGLLSL